MKLTLNQWARLGESFSDARLRQGVGGRWFTFAKATVDDVGKPKTIKTE